MKALGVSGEEVVAWALDFMSLDLEFFDSSERLKRAIDACKFLGLWDTVGEPADLYSSVSSNLERLQKEIRNVFDSYIAPFLDRGSIGRIVVKEKGYSREKVFLLEDERLFIKNRVDHDLEKVGAANFIDALQSIAPVDLSRFRKCEGCEKWFFPTGKRVRVSRRFCSPACNLRQNARLQREQLKKASSGMNGSGESTNLNSPKKHERQLIFTHEEKGK